MSWLKPYLRTWFKKYPGSVPPMKQLAHYLKPLLKAHAETRIVEELAGYLEKTPPRFLSLPKFAAAFGSWSNGHQASAKPVTTKWVEANEDGRVRLIEVPLSDPRKAV